MRVLFGLLGLLAAAAASVAAGHAPGGPMPGARPGFAGASTGTGSGGRPAARPWAPVFPIAAGLTPGPWRLTLTPAAGPVTRTVRASITFPARTGNSHGDNTAPATIWAASIIFALVVITLIAAPRPHQGRRAPRTRHRPGPPGPAARPGPTGR